MAVLTEPLRAEHRELLPHLEELRTTAASLDPWPDDAAVRLAALVDFLRGHLIPHAQAEEAVLYPAVERAMAAPGAMGTMAADHTEIVRRIDALGRTVSELGASAPAAARVEDLRAQLYGLSAILLLHFAKEEDVLLPVLDRQLSAEDAETLFAEMAAHAHGG